MNLFLGLGFCYCGCYFCFCLVWMLELIWGVFLLSINLLVLKLLKMVFNCFFCVFVFCCFVFEVLLWVEKYLE